MTQTRETCPLDNYYKLFPLFIPSNQSKVLKKYVLVKALKILKKKKTLVITTNLKCYDYLQIDTIIEKKKKRNVIFKRIYSTSLLFDIDRRCVLFFSSISTLKPPPASTIRRSPPSSSFLFPLNANVRITSARVWRSF